MKEFFVKHGKHVNQYSLAYTETADQTQRAEESGWERITRREAV